MGPRVCASAVPSFPYQGAKGLEKGRGDGEGTTTSFKNEEGFMYDGDSGFDEDGGIQFADPGGRSALRASSKRNPRNLPCPTCGRKNMLTPADRARGYQCDRCA